MPDVSGGLDDLTDDEIRVALVRLACAADEAGSVEDLAERVCTFGAAMDRLNVL